MTLGPNRTSSTNSTDAAHKRSTSAPHFCIASFASMPVPSDLLIGRPCSSLTQPFFTTCLYGAAPFTAVAVTMELRNQPRYWSPPSSTRSLGHGMPFLPSTARCVTPDSNQISTMFFSFSNLLPPHLGHVKPSGTNVSIGSRHHESAPCSRK